MKANMNNNPWNDSIDSKEPYENSFEDVFVDVKYDDSRLPDSKEYLERLYLKLKAVQKGSSKKDLVSSLAETKNDYMARLINERRYLESEDEKDLTANPVIKLIAPHLQALTASELVHLLNADALQEATTQQQDELDETKDINNDNKTNA